MGKINKTAAAAAIAVSLATFIAMTGSEAAETPAPQRGYCLLHNHGGADCSFRSKAQCEATAFDQGSECYQDDGEVYLMAMRRPLFTTERWKLGNPAVSIASFLGGPLGKRPGERNPILRLIRFNVNTDPYFSNDRTSNGEVKGIDHKGKIKPASCSQSRIDVRPRLKLTLSQLQLYAKENFHE
jgi:hypothetical protein